MPHHRQPVSPTKPGRPVDPVRGYGPAADIALRLREHRAAAGNPSYKEMAALVRSNATTLSQTDRGEKVPLEVNVENYLKACRVDEATVTAWRRAYPDYQRRAAVFRPGLGDVQHRADLHRALQDVLADARVDTALLRERRALAEQHDVPDAPAGPVPTEAELFADPPGDRALLWTVYLAGGTAGDVQHWAQPLARIGPEPSPPDLPVEPDLPAAPDVPAVAGVPGVAGVAGVFGTGDADEMSRDSSLLEPEPPSRQDPGPASPIVTAPPVDPTAVPPAGLFKGGRWQVPVAVGVCGVVLGLAGTLVYAGAGNHGKPRTEGTSSSGPAATTPAPPEEPTGVTGDAATAALNDVADRVARLPATTSTGRYAHVHRSLRSVDTTDPAAPEKVTEEWLTWSAAAPGRRVTRITADGVTTTPRPEPLPAGPPVGSAGPPTTDLVLLEQVLGVRRPSRVGPPRMLLGVADLCETYPLNTAERVAVLRLLAGVAGITVRGKGADRTGRPGIAISADHAGGKRETLIIDPADGRLLAHETSVPRPGGGDVTEDVVFLDARYDDQAG